MGAQSQVLKEEGQGAKFDLIGRVQWHIDGARDLLRLRDAAGEARHLEESSFEFHDQ